MGRPWLRAGSPALTTASMPLGGILLTFALTLLTAPAAYAHAHLKRASPAVGSKVRLAPPRLSLWFTEDVEPAFSGIAVRNAEGANVARGKARLARGKRAELQIGLKPLPPGTYKVSWHALSTDTHKTHGSFSFTVGGQ